MNEYYKNKFVNDGKLVVMIGKKVTNNMWAKLNEHHSSEVRSINMYYVM